MPADLRAKEELDGSQSAKRLLGAVFALSAGFYMCLSGSAWALEVIVFAGGFNWPIWAAQQQGFFTNTFARFAGAKLKEGLLSFPFHVGGTIDAPVFTKPGAHP